VGYENRVVDHNSRNTPFISSLSAKIFSLVSLCWFVCSPAVAVDAQFAQRKLSFERKYRFSDNGILRFRHTASNRDTEADIWRGDSGATSLGEEMFEEAR